MTKPSSKLLLVLAVALSQVIWALPANAQTTTADSLCNRLSNISNLIDQKLLEEQTQLSQTRLEKLGILSKLRAEADAKRAEEQTKLDSKSTEQLNRLATKALTKGQRLAWDKYKSEVATAVSTRRSLIQAINREFREEVDSAISAHKAIMEAALRNFQSSIKTAVAKAKTDCGKGANSGTVQRNLKANLNTVNNKLEIERGKMEQVNIKVQTLVNKRQSQVEKVNKDFKTQLQEAKEKFKKQK